MIMFQVTHKPHWLCLVPALVAALASPGLGQQASPVPEESLVRWPYFQEIELPAAGGASWYDLVIPNSVTTLLSLVPSLTVNESSRVFSLGSSV